ncbi:MAG: GNAT family N-acetyltransferase [Candidatus Omnitrophica bacterium]|nr:GNAT family N-acetyltransferase [Candidatus Omnitrophota bacterium]
MAADVLGYRFNRLINKFRYGLFLEYLQSRLTKLGCEITPFYVIREAVDRTRLKVDEPSLEGYTCEFLDSIEMEKISAIRGDGPSLEELRSRRAKGNRCFGMRYHDEIIAFNWIDSQEISSGLFRQPLKNNEAYLFDMYTDKRFRGKNIAPYLRYRTYQVLTAEGKNCFYSISNFFNKASLKFKKKLDSKPVKFGIFFRFFRKPSRSWILKKYR